MGFRENYDFSLLKNEMEEIILEELSIQLESQPDVCVCQDCVLDMAAYALNKVKPAYQVSLLGSLYAHSLRESDYREAVRETVAEAIKRISANPSHD
jgi:competence protein ComFB